MTFRHAPNSAIQFSADEIPLSGNVAHFEHCDSNLQFVTLCVRQTLDPLVNAHVLDLLRSGLFGRLLRRSLGLLGFGVGHRQFSLDFVPTVEEITEPVDGSNVTLFFVIMSPILRHADDQADGDMTPNLDGSLVVHSGGDATGVAQFLDDGMVHELGKGDLFLDEFDQAVVYSECLVLPVSLGVSGRTLGSGGLGVGDGGVGIHGVPLSLA